jgi:tetratricopeptide (TPR) repeat protein
MENGEIIRPKPRIRLGEYRELAAKGSYSLLIVILGLVLLRPVMVKHILSRADAYSAFGYYEDSKRQCNKALLLDNDSSEAWCRLARIYRAEGSREMAFGAYQRATDADARNKPAHFELAAMYVQDEDYHKAIPYLEQIRKLGPDTPEHLRRGGFPYHKASLNLLTTCYEKTGDVSKTELTLEERRAFYPNDVNFDAHLALLKQGDGK